MYKYFISLNKNMYVYLVKIAQAKDVSFHLHTQNSSFKNKTILSVNGALLGIQKISKCLFQGTIKVKWYVE